VGRDAESRPAEAAARRTAASDLKPRRDPGPQGRAAAGIRVATIHLNGTIKARGIWFNISHTRLGQDVYVIYERDGLMIFDDRGTLIIEHPCRHPASATSATASHADPANRSESVTDVLRHEVLPMS
jgi:hypothetical protein